MKLVTVFRERKDILCFCRKHQQGLKTVIGFTNTFIQRSNNFKTFGLSDHDKMPMAGSIL